MKKSVRAKRMERHHKRLNKVSKLNLVSLMDIFTILVIFLIVNSSEVEVLQSNKSIKLPESTVETRPNETIIIMVNNTDLIVQGRKLANINTLMSSSAETFEVLENELKYQEGRAGLQTDLEKKLGRAVTIMGDQKIPFKLLKKIMLTCSVAGFSNISLAVSKKLQETSNNGDPIK